MTTFLQRTGVDLVIGAVVTPLASYGLHRMFPAPDASFLIVATSVTLCVGIALRALGTQYANTYTRAYGYVDEMDNRTTNFIFHRLNLILLVATTVFFPIFARAVGQRMGSQVPGYLQTVAYFSLANSAFWGAKTIFEIFRDAYYQEGFITPSARR